MGISIYRIPFFCEFEVLSSEARSQLEKLVNVPWLYYQQSEKLKKYPKLITEICCLHNCLHVTFIIWIGIIWACHNQTLTQVYMPQTQYNLKTTFTESVTWGWLILGNHKINNCAIILNGHFDFFEKMLPKIGNL